VLFLPELSLREINMVRANYVWGGGGSCNLGEGVPAMFTRLLRNKLHMDRVKIVPALFMFSPNTSKQQGSVKGGDRQGNNCRHPRYTSTLHSRVVCH
jgi:hypothetical protein